MQPFGPVGIKDKPFSDSLRMMVRIISLCRNDRLSFGNSPQVVLLPDHSGGRGIHQLFDRASQRVVLTRAEESLRPINVYSTLYFVRCSVNRRNCVVNDCGASLVMQV